MAFKPTYHILRNEIQDWEEELMAAQTPAPKLKRVEHVSIIRSNEDGTLSHYVSHIPIDRARSIIAALSA